VSTDGHKSYPKREGKPRNNRDYFGALSVISFTPQDLELVRGSPEVRRRFLDRAIFNEQHSHLDAVLRYQKALSSRNSFLKNRASDQLLRAYEATLAEVGARLMIARATYLEQLAPLYESTLYNICQFSGRLNYRPSISVSDLSASSPQSVQQQLMKYWDQHRESDKQRGFTQRGPHSDDLTLKLNERSARSFASQGQQRAIALALKISQIESLSARLLSRPILLLDDVSSELDRGRSALLFEFLRGFEGQVLLTTTHADYVPVGDESQVWQISAGQVT
jgi:DNA replication and repair protein RecF